VSPILGIIASQNYPRVTNSYESIATVTVGSGGSASVSFSSIPATYTHLQIRGIGKSAGGSDSLDLTFNGDVGSSQYTYHALYGDGSSAGSENNRPRANIPTTITLVPSSDTNIFAAGIIDILDYTNTNKNKTVRILAGQNVNSTSGEAIFLTSGLWMSTSAVTSITLTGRSTNIGQYSQFALYGIKGA
jgi:hypothetical protein